MADHEMDILTLWQYRANPTNQFHTQYHKMCNRIFGTVLFLLIETFVVVTSGWWGAIVFTARFIWVGVALICVLFLCWVAFLTVMWFVYWLLGRETSM